MISWQLRRCLIVLAFQLIALAELRLAPGGRRRTKANLEGSSERLGRTEADKKRDLQDRHPRLCNQPQRRRLQSSPSNVIAQGLPEPCREQTVEMKRREVRNPGQRVELQLLIELPVDVLEHAVHARDILGAAIGRARHSTEAPRLRIVLTAFSGVPRARAAR